MIAYLFGPTLMLSVQASFFTELFGTRVRYTALSFAYQVSAIIGGFVPLLSMMLLQANGGKPWLVAGALCGVSIISLACVLAAEKLPETTAERKERQLQSKK